MPEIRTNWYGFSQQINKGMSTGLRKTAYFTILWSDLSDMVACDSVGNLDLLYRAYHLIITFCDFCQIFEKYD